MNHSAFSDRTAPGWGRLGLLAAIGILMTVAPTFGQQPKDHALFKKLVGSWHAEGKMTVAESGDVITVIEDWKGEFDDEGRLVVEGTRKLNDNEHTFRWVYSYNDASELYEALYSDSNSEEERSWQVSVMESESQMEVRAPMGEGATLTLLRTIKDGSFDAKVTIVDASGTESVSGTVKHTREGSKKTADEK